MIEAYPDDDLWRQEMQEWEAAFMRSVYDTHDGTDIFRFEYVLRGTPCIIGVTHYEVPFSVHPVFLDCYPDEAPVIEYRVMDIFGNLDKDLMASITSVEDADIKEEAFDRMDKRYE